MEEEDNTVCSLCGERLGDSVGVDICDDCIMYSVLLDEEEEYEQ